MYSGTALRIAGQLVPKGSAVESASTLHGTRAQTSVGLLREAIPFLHDAKANIGLVARRGTMTNDGR
jgi:hypothetical protein